VEADLSLVDGRTDGQTDKTNLKICFSNFAV